ncbi:MAG: hypothetical protein FJ221_07680 [Lentisphaerae bacterium]|nr:hypothetical protein [Lentisphaerota bacterium]
MKPLLQAGPNGYVPVPPEKRFLIRSLFLPGHLFHPSPAGHRIIGGGLARAIVDGGLLPP